MYYKRYMLKSNVQKYSKTDGVKWQIQHEANPSAVFDMTPQPFLLYYSLYHE